MEYVEEMIDYCGAPIKEMLDDANRKLADQARLINSLRLKIEQDSSDREQQLGEVIGCITKLEGSVRMLKMFIWGTIFLVSTWLAIGGSASSLVTILLAVTSMYVVVG